MSTNTGFKKYTYLELYYPDNNASLGVIKANVSTDPNYIGPAYDPTLCALGTSTCIPQTIYSGETYNKLRVRSYSSFNPDGTKLYLTQHNNGLSGGAPYDPIIVYNLATPWDVSTITTTGYTSGSKDASGGTGTPRFQFADPAVVSINTAYSSGETQTLGHYFSPDGLKLFTTGYATGLIQKYTLSVAWDISTLTLSSSTTGYVSTLGVNIRSIKFSSDGLTMILLGSTTARYTLSSAWNIIGGTLVSTMAGNNYDIDFQNNGLYLFTFDGSGNLIRKTLSSAYDLTSVTGTQSLNVTTLINGNSSPVIHFKDDFKGYISTYTPFIGNSVTAFELGCSFDISAFITTALTTTTTSTTTTTTTTIAPTVPQTTTTTTTTTTLPPVIYYVYRNCKFNTTYIVQTEPTTAGTGVVLSIGQVFGVDEGYDTQYCDIDYDAQGNQIDFCYYEWTSVVGCYEYIAQYTTNPNLTTSNYVYNYDYIDTIVGTIYTTANNCLVALGLTAAPATTTTTTTTTTLALFTTDPILYTGIPGGTYSYVGTVPSNTTVSVVSTVSSGVLLGTLLPPGWTFTSTGTTFTLTGTVPAGADYIITLQAANGTLFTQQFVSVNAVYSTLSNMEFKVDYRNVASTAGSVSSIKTTSPINTSASAIFGGHGCNKAQFNLVAGVYTSTNGGQWEWTNLGKVNLNNAGTATGVYNLLDSKIPDLALLPYGMAVNSTWVNTASGLQGDDGNLPIITYSTGVTQSYYNYYSSGTTVNSLDRTSYIKISTTTATQLANSSNWFPTTGTNPNRGKVKIKLVVNSYTSGGVLDVHTTDFGWMRIFKRNSTGTNQVEVLNNSASFIMRGTVVITTDVILDTVSVTQ